jgi:phosphatidylglycerophosphatase C
MDLALFDFDGTITTIGTYPGFLRFAVRPRRKLVGYVLLAPLIIGYLLKIVSEPAIRKATTKVGFLGDEPCRLHRLGERYAAEVLPDLIRPLALERIAWHKARGDRVVVVSASLDFYLEPWCKTVGVDLICSQMETRDGRLTGRYLAADCCGGEKDSRIRARYSLAEYATVYAYGDSDEDRRMLEMADKRYFRWEEVVEVTGDKIVMHWGSK